MGTSRVAVSYGSTPKRTVPPFGQSSAAAGNEHASVAAIAIAAGAMMGMALLTEENCAFMLRLLLSACWVIVPASNGLPRVGGENPARPATRACQNRVRIACISPEAFGAAKGDRLARQGSVNARTGV